jgi:hypothetical protein
MTAECRQKRETKLRKETKDRKRTLNKSERREEDKYNDTFPLEHLF